MENGNSSKWGDNMPTIEEIKSQIQNIDGVNKWLAQKEIKELPNILWDDEIVEKLIRGRFNKGTGVLVATNKRLVFVDKGMLFGLKVEDFAYDKISSIQYETGILMGKIKIFASGNTAEIDKIPKKHARDFAESARARMTGVMEHVSTSKNTETIDVATQLEKLVKLKEQGVLTDEEFQTQKKKILES